MPAVNKHTYLNQYKDAYKLRIMKNLDERLLAARNRCEKKQNVIAHETGMTQAAYSQLETGKTNKTAHIARLAQSLNVDPLWLETGQGEMSITAVSLTADEMAFLEIYRNLQQHQKIYLAGEASELIAKSENRAAKTEEMGRERANHHPQKQRKTL